MQFVKCEFFRRGRAPMRVQQIATVALIALAVTVAYDMHQKKAG